MPFTVKTGKKTVAMYNYANGGVYLSNGWSISYGTSSSIHTSLLKESGSSYIEHAYNVKTYLKIWRTDSDCDLTLANANFKAFRFSYGTYTFPDSFFTSDDDTSPAMPSNLTDVTSSMQVSKTGNVIEIVYPTISSTYGVIIPISMGMLNSLIKETPKYSYSVTTQIANCVVSGIESGEHDNLSALPELNVIVTPNEGYEFLTANKPVMTYNDSNGDLQTLSFILNNGVANLQFTPIDGTSYTLTAQATEQENVQYTYTVESYLMNAVLSGIELGTTVQTTELLPIEIRIDANEGYEFTSSNKPYISYTDTNNDTIETYFEIDGTSDNKTCKCTITPMDSITYIIRGTATATGENQLYSGLVTIYNVTKDQLTQIANTRYYHTENLPNVETVDLGNYITGIWEYPFTVIGNSPCKIVLGGYEIPSLKTTCITNPNVRIVFNPITLPVLAGDYDCKIWLPFSGFHNLDYNYIKGSKISLVYDVDMYNADAMISILNNGELIDTYTCKIARSLPYKTYTNNITTHMNDSYNGNTMLMNNLIPFILVTQTNTNQFKFIMTKDEYDELTSLLKEGVVYG